MNSTPITSSYAPSAFFPPPRRPQHRAPRLRRRSSSSSSGTASSSWRSTGSLSTSEDEDEDDDSSDLDDESTDSDGSLSSGGGGLERTSGLMRSIRGAGTGSSARATILPASGPAHSHLKLSLALLRVRQSLSSPSPSFDSLATSLKSLSTCISTSSADLASLGVFVPILERLSRDLEDMLGEEEKGSKEWRRGLKKEEARALVGLRQRWLGMGEGKGKGRVKDGGELEWVSAVRELVVANPPPSFLRPPPALQTATSSFLTSLESLLLPSSLPRLALSNLNLTSSSFSRLEVVHRAEEVLEWYLSFPSDQEPTASARSLLLSVRSLDLSKNRLSTLPPTLPLLLPGLETLSLSHNAFRLLSPSLSLFSHLRRLNLNGNQLARRGRTKLPRLRGLHSEKEWLEAAEAEQKAGSRSNTREVGQVVRARMDRWRQGMALEGDSTRGKRREVPSEARKVQTLVEVTLQVVQAARQFEDSVKEEQEPAPTTTSTASPDQLASYSSRPSPPSSLLADLPQHLFQALDHSYTCASCHIFISPFSSLAFSPSSSSASLAPRLDPISLHLPPFYERLHFLSPGVNLPTQIRPPPSTPSSSPSLLQPHHLTTEERVLLALYGRGTDLTTLVVGDEVHHRFCTRCAIGHLGLLGEEGEGLEDERERLGRACECRGCEEERRVKDEPLFAMRDQQGTSAPGQERVMRWLRRRVRRSRGMVGL